MTDLHEFIVYEFKDGVPLNEQREAIKNIGPAVATLPGFKHLDYYYSEADQRWLSHVVWQSEDFVNQPVPDFEENAELASIIDRLKIESMRYARYRLEGTESKADSVPGATEAGR